MANRRDETLAALHKLGLSADEAETELAYREAEADRIIKQEGPLDHADAVKKARAHLLADRPFYVVPRAASRSAAAAQVPPAARPVARRPATPAPVAPPRQLPAAAVAAFVKANGTVTATGATAATLAAPAAAEVAKATEPPPTRKGPALNAALLAAVAPLRAPGASNEAPTPAQAAIQAPVAEVAAAAPYATTAAIPPPVAEAPSTATAAMPPGAERVAPTIAAAQTTVIDSSVPAVVAEPSPTPAPEAAKASEVVAAATSSPEAASSPPVTATPEAAEPVVEPAPSAVEAALPAAEVEAAALEVSTPVDAVAVAVAEPEVEAVIATPSAEEAQAAPESGKPGRKLSRKERRALQVLQAAASTEPQPAVKRHRILFALPRAIARYGRWATGSNLHFFTGVVMPLAVIALVAAGAVYAQTQLLTSTPAKDSGTSNQSPAPAGPTQALTDYVQTMEASLYSYALDLDTLGRLLNTPATNATSQAWADNFNRAIADMRTAGANLRNIGVPFCVVGPHQTLMGGVANMDSVATNLVAAVRSNDQDALFATATLIDTANAQLDLAAKGIRVAVC